jgi:alginate O-acetyltransferase complex protein AlgJ
MAEARASRGAEIDGCHSSEGAAGYPKVLAGKDGWLFIAYDRNEVVAQHAGERLLSAEQLASWARVLERRSRVLEQRRIAYAFMVAPDTHAVYPDKLPGNVTQGQRRPVTQLIDHLASSGSSVRPIYPLAEMQAARADGLVCSPCDGHWSDLGAFVAYTRLAEELQQLVPMRPVQVEEVVFVDQCHQGDLGGKLDPRHRDWTVIAYQPRGSARLVHDNLVENTGTVISTTCTDAPGSCVLLGDSYATALLQFFAESFGRFTFLHTSTLDLAYIEREMPDVVVSLMAERFLVRVPDDEHAPGTTAHAARKLASGRTRLRRGYWDVHMAPDGDVVDRLRSELRAQGRLRDAAIVSAVALGGLRPREVSRLRWRDVHEDGLCARGERRSVQARDVGDRPIDTSDEDALCADRLVPLSTSAVEDLKRWRATCGEAPRPNAVVFPAADRRGWKVDDWIAWQKDVCEPFAARLGLPALDLGLLRHSFAIRLTEAGVSEEEIARQMGVNAARIAGLYAERLLSRQDLSAGFSPGGP